MSKGQMDLENGQDAPFQDPHFINADAVQRTKASSPDPVSRPPQQPSGKKRAWWFVVVATILVLAVISGVMLLLLAQGGRHPTTQATPTPAPTGSVSATPGGDLMPSPTPGVVLGPQPGPAPVSDPAYWDKLLNTQARGGKVERVSFAHIEGKPTLQALISVRYQNAQRTLDLYVFDAITSPRPVQVFTIRGLIDGDAKISLYNTVLVAQVDQNSTVNTGKNSQQWIRDLCREFAWNQGEGTLTQTAFPGLFPDLTRYQAEADQVRVQQGQDLWKNDAAQVASRLAARFLGWERPLTATIIKGGGTRDVNATVLVSETAIQGTQFRPSITVTLSRLEGNSHNMWEAVAVTDGANLTIKNIEARSQIGNPVKIEGNGSAFEGVIGRALVLDHLYNDIGHARVTAVPGTGMGNTAFTTKVLYSTSFRAGVQEGIVEVQAANGGISDESSSAVLIKVLLTPEPGISLGPLPGPDQAQQASYWVPIIGLDTKHASIGTPMFANMKGNASLQALIPVYHTDGSQLVDIYIYDQITSAHPVQLFKLQGLYRGGAFISGYSTILTAQVDPNSSVNKGKSGDQLTTDLYREFKWSEGAGIFVPTAFPGLFPDLTRYQAELDQNTIRAEQDQWKNNAVQVAQRMAAQLLKWPQDAAASLVNGGTAQDVDALVQVKSPYPGGMSVNVALSRLEGDTSNMWVVIGVTSGNGLLTIDTPVKGDHLSSPATIAGRGSAFEGVVGRAYILDHWYAAIGQAQVMGVSNGKTAYQTTVSYTSSFREGTQEGIVVVYMYSQADGSIATAAMQKVLLGA